MSRSQNNELEKPAKKYFEWSGSKGKIKAFDKALGEKGENVWFDLPFTFLVLDKLTTIKGFSDADQSGFWSNEIRDTRTEILTVKTKKGIAGEGLYKDLANVLNQGAAYSQSVYIAYMEEGVLTLGNLNISGSAIGAWIDFCKGKKIYEIAVQISEAIPAKKGATEYFVPVFLSKPVSEKTQNEALELDKELQIYLTEYFKRAGTVHQDTPPVSDEAIDTYYKNQPDPDKKGTEENHFATPTVEGTKGEIDDDCPF